jgi:hypothetical protein
VNATETETNALTEMLRVSRAAQGQGAALANVRRECALAIDAACAPMRVRGVDVDALLDALDAQLDAE